MKKMTFLVGMLAMALVFGMTVAGCASGPEFGNPTQIQQTLNAVSDQFPIDIAGKQVKLSFEGDFWRGKVNGKDVLAGDCKIEENAEGATITLNQSWAFIDTGKKNAITGEPITTWQKTPGPAIILDYKKGPPASLAKK